MVNRLIILVKLTTQNMIERQFLVIENMSRYDFLFFFYP